MTNAPADSRPSDTRMMGIVHDALRRDLSRAIRALSEAPFPEGPRRRALGEHVGWLMGFLEAHHHGEDEALWPLVRSREPSAAALLDSMEADHATIAPRIAACAGTAAAYAGGTDDGARATLLAALEDLAAALLPHLEREEEEMMPLASVSITHAEWKAIDEEYYVGPKSLTELGFEGHWLLDGLDAARSQVVVHQVPLLPRLVLVHGFARSYRKYATACWGPPTDGAPGATRPYGPAAKQPRLVGLSGHAETVAPAPPAAVWDVVADVTRTSEWSGECRKVEWLGDATAAVPGAMFTGANRAGPWTWKRKNEILVADRPRTLAWRTVPETLFPDSSEWRFRLEEVDGGTRITQAFEVVEGPAVLRRLYALLVPSHVDRVGELRADLQRLGAVAAKDAYRQRHQAASRS